MKPAFALTLSHDGVRLLHRTARGWMLVGDADLEDQHIDETLRFLRKTAAALAPEGVATKLVLPNSQVLFTEAEAPGPSDEERAQQIAAALAGRTPYPVEDLVFDWSGSGSTVQVAVVTRLTLQEAEDFAEAHGFNPVCQVTIPEDGSFSGEPFFGLTTRAAEHMPPGAVLDRDADPVRIVGRADLPKDPVVTVEDTVPAAMAADMAAAAAVAGDDGAADDVAAVAGPAAAPPPAPAVPDAGTPAAESPATESRAEDLLAAGAAPGALAAGTQTAAGSDADAAAAESPSAASDMSGTSAGAEGPAEEAAEAAADGPDPLLPAAEAAEAPAAAADATGDEAPFAQIEDDDDLPPPVGFTTRRRPPFAAAPADAADPSGAPALGAARPGLSVTAPVVPAPAGAEEPAPEGGEMIATALRKRAGARKPGRPEAPAGRTAAPAAPVVDPRPLRRPHKTAQQESQEMTVFGARRAGSAARVGGKPRYLGLLLVAALAVLMAAVALGSLWFGEDRPAPETTADSQPAAAQAPLPGDTATGATADIPSPDAPDDEALADGEPDAGPVTAGTDPAADTATAGPADTEADAARPAATATSPAPADTAPADTAAADTAPADTAAVSPQPTEPAPAATATAEAPALAAGIDAALSEATATPAPSADTAVATGGNEAALPAQSAPDAPAAADLGSGDTAPAAADAGDLPAQSAMLHDAPLAPQPLAPAFGALIKYDARGFIIPSKEGVQTPEGTTLYLGRPPLLPKARPEAVTTAAAAAAAAAAQSAAQPAAQPAAATDPAQPAAGPAPEPYADPALAGKRPVARPAALEQPGDQGAATPAADPLSAPDPRFAGFRPQARPAAILTLAATAAAVAQANAPPPDPAAGVPEAAATATAADLGSATRLAVAASRRPAGRPSDISKAVDSAVAAAIAEPTPAAAPEPQPQPEVQVAAAPEPAPEAPAVTEIDEPEPVKATLDIPTSASVAKQATFANAIDLGKVNLIGVFGGSGDRRALVRTSNGRYVRLKVGDRFDGGRVAAIGDGQLTYVKNGRTIVLKMVKAG